MQPMWLRVIRRRTPSGFLLVELLLALAIGLVLVAQIAQSTLQETGQARQLGRLLRERVVTQRALELIRAEAQEALEVSLVLPPSGHADCGLEDRKIVLHLLTSAEAITYSLERNPASIWQGQVLMRCGPSYGLVGTLNEGKSSVSRVLLDALAPDGIKVTRSNATRVLQMELQREFKQPGAMAHQLDFKITMPAPGLPLQK